MLHLRWSVKKLSQSAGSVGEGWKRARSSRRMPQSGRRLIPAERLAGCRVWHHPPGARQAARFKDGAMSSSSSLWPLLRWVVDLGIRVDELVADPGVRKRFQSVFEKG